MKKVRDLSSGAVIFQPTGEDLEKISLKERLKTIEMKLDRITKMVEEILIKIEGDN